MKRTIALMPARTFAPILLATLSSVAALLAGIAVQAQDYPNRAIRIIVPSVPGGVVDFTSRVLAPKLSELWRQPVVVENRAGGNGIIGMESASKAATAANLKVPMMGGDGIKDDAFITKAGPDSVGTMASSVGMPVDKLASAEGFLKAYKAAGFTEGSSEYGVYAYDVIRTLKASLATAKTPSEARSAVIKALATTTFDGSGGPVAFDAFGDPKTPKFTLYKVVGTAWVAQG